MFKMVEKTEDLIRRSRMCWKAYFFPNSNIQQNKKNTQSKRIISNTGGVIFIINYRLVNIHYFH